jgi:hypothetical protein
MNYRVPRVAFCFLRIFLTISTIFLFRAPAFSSPILKRFQLLQKPSLVRRRGSGATSIVAARQKKAADRKSEGKSPAAEVFLRVCRQQIFT